MRKSLPLLLFFGFVVLFFRQFFLHALLPIPADTIVGLYNPYRDSYAAQYPRGIPFKNFLITDPVRQLYPWRWESILQEKKWQLPLWNPYSLSGTPLLANGQSAGFSPFNILFFMLPFPLSWSILIFLQPILAGLFLFWYLKNLKLHALACLLGSIAFTFSGFFVVWLEWGTVDMVVLWTPFLLLCIDKIYTGSKKVLWYPFYFAALCISFFAGHLQTFFYALLLVHIYLLLHWLKTKHKRKHLLWGLLFGFIACVVASIQWYPLLQFILLSGRETDLTISAGWFIPIQHLITFLVPDFFGNPTTLNYWGVWNYAELAGYIGLPALLFALYATGFLVKNKRILFFTISTLVALLFALPTPLGMLPNTLHIPFLATAQPTRLLFVIDFSLSVLAAYGLDIFMKSQKKIIFLLAAIWFVFAGLWIVVYYAAKLHITILPENLSVAKHNMIFPTSILLLITLFVFLAIFIKNKKVFLFIIFALVLLSGVDSFRFADKFTPFTKAQYLYPQTAAITFLEQQGIFRIMTTDSQILPPNFSTVYHIQSVDGYDPLYNKAYGQLIAISERQKPDLTEPFGFNRILTPHNYKSRLMDLLGVKYILSLTKLSDTKLQFVFSEGQTQIYKNLQAFPRAFFVKQVFTARHPQEAANFLFDPARNLHNQAIAFGALPKDFLPEGSVTITSYAASIVELQTENTGTGFLVLTDSYYPTWHASIDGKETKIYQTDLALRGVFVPAGKHRVEFRDRLF